MKREVRRKLRIVHDHKDQLRTEDHAELERQGKLVAHVVRDPVGQVRKYAHPKEPQSKYCAEVPARSQASGRKDWMV